MASFINPPPKIPLMMRPGIWLAKKITGKDLEVSKILSWYPKTAIGSAILESLVAHKDKTLSKRMLKIVRIQASFAVSCPFCIDMNSAEYVSYFCSRTCLQGNPVWILCKRKRND